MTNQGLNAELITGTLQPAAKRLLTCGTGRQVFVRTCKITTCASASNRRHQWFKRDPARSCRAIDPARVVCSRTANSAARWSRRRRFRRNAFLHPPVRSVTAFMWRSKTPGKSDGSFSLERSSAVRVFPYRRSLPPQRRTRAPPKIPLTGLAGLILPGRVSDCRAANSRSVRCRPASRADGTHHGAVGRLSDLRRGLVIDGGLRDLGQGFVGLLLFGQGLVDQLGGLRIVELERPGLQRAVA